MYENENFEQVNITRAFTNYPILETKVSLDNPNFIYKSIA